MDSVSWSHFNASYVMLLRTEKTLFIWIGRSSSSIERRLAFEHATKHYAKNAKIVIVDDGYEQSLNDLYKTQWNSLLPLSKRNVNQALVTPAVPGLCVGNSQKMAIYKCTYRDGRLSLDQLNIPLPTKDELSDSSTIYVLDCQTQGVWLWVGALTTVSEKVSAMSSGRAFVKKKEYPFTTPIIRVVEGHEPIEFTRLFPHWSGDWGDICSLNMKPISTMLGKFDAVTLCQRPKMAAETQLIDHGQGDKRIYRIGANEIIEIIASTLNIFTTTSCYVVTYSVAVNIFIHFLFFLSCFN